MAHARIGRALVIAPAPPAGRIQIVRILHILAERGYSGGEDQLAYVLEGLRRAGHENALMLQPGAAFAETARRLEIPVHELRMRNDLHLGAILRLRRVLKRVPVHLVHLADSRAHKLAGWAVFGRRRPPMVVTRRMDYPLRRGLLTRRLYGRVVDDVVAVSEAVAQEVRSIGVKPEQVHVIPDGVDAAAFENLERQREGARAALGFAAEDLVVLSAASLRPRKGQAILVRAFASLAGHVPAARLLLAGEGSERAALEREIEARGLQSRVLLPGRLPIRRALAAADVACVPSLKEGLSVFSLEAQAAGLPVVASRVGGLSESVSDGESGLLFEPGDETALATSLQALLGDEAERQRLGQAGQARVAAHFTAAEMVRRTVALYEQIGSAPD